MRDINIRVPGSRRETYLPQKKGIQILPRARSDDQLDLVETDAVNFNMADSPPGAVYYVLLSARRHLSCR